MKKYRLKRDLPIFKAGKECWLNAAGDLVTEVLIGDRADNPKTAWEETITVYPQRILEKFPSILTDWFEEISEEPKTVWDLEEGDKCWMLDIDFEPMQIEWRGTPYDLRLRELGRISITIEELLRQVSYEEAKQILLQDTKGFKPNWDKYDLWGNWKVSYNYASETLGCWENEDNDGTIRFANKQDAEVSIRNHEKEWKIYLGVEENTEISL